MVSTRGPKSRFFEKGEKVLCYEPDQTKAKVLYDSKILGIHESKDKRGRKIIQYKVHFQGWSSSWDRKVNADYVLKDTEENRQLQRDLAEKAQLHLGAYLYRKERGNKKNRSRKINGLLNLDADSGGGSVGCDPNATLTSSCAAQQQQQRCSSEDNFSSGSTFEKHEDISMNDECDSCDDSCSSSIESIPEEDRVLLRVGDRLRQYLENDQDMVLKHGNQHSLPARLPVVMILENFVKQTAVKMAMSTTKNESTRRRSTQQRTDKKEREFDKLVTTVGLLKEVADGLRIYFDFTVADYLLYMHEKTYCLSYLTEEYLKNFNYVASPGLSPDFLQADKCSGDLDLDAMNYAYGELQQSALGSNEAGLSTFVGLGSAQQVDEAPKRKLRSYRSDDGDVLLDNCFSSVASTSSSASTPVHPNAAHIIYLKSIQPSLNIPPQTKDFLQGVLSWRLLPMNATPAPSMIFGATHLARLIVRLPEFLNASTMSNEKLKLLLIHLDTFVQYLESRMELFTDENYVQSSTALKTTSTNSNDSNTTASIKIDSNEIKVEQELKFQLELQSRGQQQLVDDNKESKTSATTIEKMEIATMANTNTSTDRITSFSFNIPTATTTDTSATTKLTSTTTH